MVKKWPKKCQKHPKIDENPGKSPGKHPFFGPFDVPESHAFSGQKRVKIRSPRKRRKTPLFSTSSMCRNPTLFLTKKGSEKRPPEKKCAQNSEKVEKKWKLARFSRTSPRGQNTVQRTPNFGGFGGFVQGVQRIPHDFISY